jgi:hypothetical protein
VFTTARQLSLSWARLIQSKNLPSSFCKIRLNIILSSKPRSSKWPFPSGSPPKPCISFLFPPFVLHAPQVTSSCIRSPESYLVGSRSNEAPHHEIVSSLLVFAPSTHSNTASWSSVLVCLCIYHPDDDLVEVETCRRNISDIIICYWVCSLLHQIQYNQCSARNAVCVTCVFVS